MADYTLFCDETGNSGSRFFQPEQPFYIEGGWIVANEDRAAATAAFLALEKLAKYTPKTKGSSLKKSAPGRAHLRAVCEMMTKHAAPYISIVEKRYAVCAKAVETYFDAAYNEAIHHQELWDPDARQARAEVFYALTDSEVARFADAYRQKDSAAVVAIGHDWAKLISDAGKSQFAAEIRAGLPTLQGHIQSEFDAISSDSLPVGYDSLNLPIVAQVFQTIEQNSPPIDIVHDECASFQALYSHVFHQMRNARPSQIVLKDGRKHVTGFQRIESLAFGDSEREPMLRAADYLVACCSEFAQSVAEGKPVDPDIAKVSRPAIGQFVVWALSQTHNSEPMPKLAELFGSEAWLGQCFTDIMPFMLKSGHSPSSSAP
jgi:hypothetical protein